VAPQNEIVGITVAITELIRNSLTVIEWYQDRESVIF